MAALSGGQGDTRHPPARWADYHQFFEAHAAARAANDGSEGGSRRLPPVLANNDARLQASILRTAAPDFANWDPERWGQGEGETTHLVF